MYGDQATYLIVFTQEQIIRNWYNVFTVTMNTLCHGVWIDTFEEKYFGAILQGIALFIQ